MVWTRGDTAGKPVERFKATSGQITGVVGLAIAVATVCYLLAAVHTLTGLRLGLAAVLFGAVVWISQLRPRATAYVDTLVLHNMLRDTFIPLRLVDDAIVRQTLNVWVGDEKHVCIGIGRTVRALTGHKAPKARFLGLGKMQDMAEQANIPHLEQTAMPYATFVETRLADLVGYARKEPDTGDRTVRRTWAWPELVLLVTSGVAFVVSLFL